MGLKSYLREIFAPNIYIQPSPLTVTVSPVPRVEATGALCPLCRESVHPEAKRCPHCTGLISR